MEQNIMVKLVSIADTPRTDLACAPFYPCMVELVNNDGELQTVSARVWAKTQDNHGVEPGKSYRAKKQLYVKDGEVKVDITVSHLTTLGAPIAKASDLFTAEEIEAILAASGASSKADFTG